MQSKYLICRERERTIVGWNGGIRRSQKSFKALNQLALHSVCGALKNKFIIHMHLQYALQLF